MIRYYSRSTNLIIISDVNCEKKGGNVWLLHKPYQFVPSVMQNIPIKVLLFQESRYPGKCVLGLLVCVCVLGRTWLHIYACSVWQVYFISISIKSSSDWTSTYTPISPNTNVTRGSSPSAMNLTIACPQVLSRIFKVVSVGNVSLIAPMVTL